MLRKAIIQGRIEYGTAKSFAQAVKMYEYRAENYHKSDALFEIEEIFFEETFTLEIPRYVKQVYDKTFRNTVALLEYCTQFGVAGEIDAWLIDEGKVIKFDHFEPNSDKVVVQRFLKGKALIGQEGQEEKAIEHFTKAIEKYDKHSQAYQRRAKVNRILKKNHDAIRDYNKSITADSTNPFAYYGRSKVHLINEDVELAIEDLEHAIKKSVALQPVYWKSRRVKGKCHFDLKQYEKAAFDFKLFNNRKFDKDNPNIPWKRYVAFYYGETLVGQEEYEAAIELYEHAMSLPPSPTNIEDAELLTRMGFAKWKAGKNGYIKDWTDAAALGNKTAKKLLKENS